MTPVHLESNDENGTSIEHQVEYLADPDEVEVIEPPYEIDVVILD
jgi:hypothetical protein